VNIDDKLINPPSYSQQMISNWFARSSAYRRQWQVLHLDRPLVLEIGLLLALGMAILYSASNQNLTVLFHQGMRLLLAATIMLIIAQVPPNRLRRWSPSFYFGSLALLIAVLLLGKFGKGAQRWLAVGGLRFQPSEFLKISVPMMLAYFLSNKPLPPTKRDILKAGIIILVPVLLIAKQPDLGTALLIASSAGGVLILAGMPWRWVAAITAATAALAPIAWHFMHGYQRLRVLTFLNPERDPLGSGYHIIQSKIAIGSGGLFGKGWLHGTQSHLQFLPEHATDFIFAVCGEEFGLFGALVLIFTYSLIIARGCVISNQAQDTYTRLLAGSLTLTFFMAIFINIGMVIGILPVVGLPLPLVSYGGTSMVTMMTGFGMLMSIHTHRQLLRQ